MGLVITECPQCGSGKVRFSRSRTPWEKLCTFIGYCRFRCKECGGRFSEGILWLPGMHFARCPRCLREDLSDWAEKYYYPPWYQQIWLKVGAREQRCPACRVNFVSFLPRRRQFVPSWKESKPDDTRPEAAGT